MILPISIAVIMELNRKKLPTSASQSTVDNLPPTYGAVTIDMRGKPEEELYALDEFATSSAANIADVVEAAEIKADEMHHEATFNFDELPRRQKEIAKALVLCVAYSSSIGGKLQKMS